MYIAQNVFYMSRFSIQTKLFSRFEFYSAKTNGLLNYVLVKKKLKKAQLRGQNTGEKVQIGSRENEEKMLKSY